MSKPSSKYSGNDDAAVRSRRDVLAGIGALASVFAVAGWTLRASSPAEARINTPVIEPKAVPADAAKAEFAEDESKRNLADLDSPEFTDVSAQRRYWRRPRRRYWRRPRLYLRRSRWRRRYRRVVW